MFELLDGPNYYRVITVTRTSNSTFPFLHAPCSPKATTPSSMAHYPYMTDLMQLDAHRPQHPESYVPHLGAIHAPYNIEAWSQCLIHHPDQKFAQYNNRTPEWVQNQVWLPKLHPKVNITLAKAHCAQFINSEHVWTIFSPDEIQYLVLISRFSLVLRPFVGKTVCIWI